MDLKTRIEVLPCGKCEDMIGCDTCLFQKEAKELYKQIRADIIDELYNKIDEGVCDICEHKDFENDCFKMCNYEVENAKKWLLQLKEQNK